MYSPFNYYNQNIALSKPLIKNYINPIGAYNNFITYSYPNNNLKNINNINNISNNGLLKCNSNKKFKGNMPNLAEQKINTILTQLKSCVCKICTQNDDNATGFFCKIPVFNSNLCALITNYHVLNEDDIKVNRIIKIFLKDNKKEKKREKVKEIVINEPRITFTDKDLDITIIEIIPKVDGINDFLEIDENFDGLTLEETIYILQKPEGESSFSIGVLQERDKESNAQDFFYICYTFEGSSGSPILGFENSTVIGVHKGSQGSIKIGTLIKYIIVAFEKTYDINKSKLNLPEKEKEKGAKKKPLSNGDYYVGHYENGKIAIYYSDGKLKYEGDRKDGNFEGKGTYYYKNGNRYEGEWKNGLKHGKGILYYDLEAKNKRYEGNYIKGWDDGSYYIGDFVKGLKHGYGKYYKKDGTLKYEGGFVNDKYGGKGLYFCNNGDYYRGDFKNGLKHGEGTLYNKKDEVIQKGKFIDNKYQDIK